MSTASVITSNDKVIVQGRYLVYKTNPAKRFFIKGIAFPNAPHNRPYDVRGWVAILQQIRDASPLVNTIRLYSIDASRDYSEFIETAAKLGFYLLIPVTSNSGGGVLNRNLAAPKCYKKKLYQYGYKVIKKTYHHPNILGYVLGNEIMNSLESWQAAPCILAYSRDLKKSFPKDTITLMYTMQHDGIGAAVSPSETVQLTLNYMTSLSCSKDSKSMGATIDVLGINIESWCSSVDQSFDTNPDGSIGSYKDLYQHVENSTIPLFFSETGCSTALFNHDNGLSSSFRDWGQVSTVLGQSMNEEWSGLVAYAYDGPPFFRMTTGGPWDGLNVLEFTPDMTNFLDQLEQQQQNNDNTTEIQKATTRDLCVDDNDVYGESLSKCCNLELLPVNKILSYAHMHDSHQNKMTVGLYSIHYFYSPIIFIGFSLTLLIIQSLYRRKIRNQQQYDDQQQDWIDIPDHNNCANYNTFY